MAIDLGDIFSGLARGAGSAAVGYGTGKVKRQQFDVRQDQIAANNQFKAAQLGISQERVGIANRAADQRAATALLHVYDPFLSNLDNLDKLGMAGHAPDIIADVHDLHSILDGQMTLADFHSRLFRAPAQHILDHPSFPPEAHQQPPDIEANAATEGTGAASPGTDVGAPHSAPAGDGGGLGATKFPLPLTPEEQDKHAASVATTKHTEAETAYTTVHTDLERLELKFRAKKLITEQDLADANLRLKKAEAAQKALTDPLQKEELEQRIALIKEQIKQLPLNAHATRQHQHNQDVQGHERNEIAKGEATSKQALRAQNVQNAIARRNGLLNKPGVKLDPVVQRTEQRLFAQVYITQPSPGGGTVKVLDPVAYAKWAAYFKDHFNFDVDKGEATPGHPTGAIVGAKPTATPATGDAPPTKAHTMVWNILKDEGEPAFWKEYATQPKEWKQFMLRVFGAYLKKTKGTSKRYDAVTARKGK